MLKYVYRDSFPYAALLDKAAIVEGDGVSTEKIVSYTLWTRIWFFNGRLYREWLCWKIIVSVT